MPTHKIMVTISVDHQLAVQVPDDFPVGPAEVIIQAASPAKLRLVRLAGVLAPQGPPSSQVDAIADALQDFRYERQQRAEKLETTISGLKDSSR